MFLQGACNGTERLAFSLVQWEAIALEQICSENCCDFQPWFLMPTGKKKYNQNREVMETSEQCSKTFQDLSYEWNSCVNVGNCLFYDDDKKQSAMMLIKSGRAATRSIQTLQGCEIQTWSGFLRYALTLNVCIMRIYPKTWGKKSVPLERCKLFLQYYCSVPGNH